jgi:hypothetical protein
MNCGSANVYLHYPADCPAGAYKGSVAAGACLTIDFNGSEDLRASNKNQQIQPGACTAQQTGGIPTPSFQDSARACAANTTQGSCDPAQVCVPPAQPGFQLCLYQAGVHSCPAGYDKPETYYGSVNDTRSCSACSCAAPTGTCSGTFTMYSDAACQNALGTSTIACGDSVQVAQSISYNPSVDNVSCPASNSALSGSATEQDPITVCCQ